MYECTDHPPTAISATKAAQETSAGSTSAASSLGPSRYKSVQKD